MPFRIHRWIIGLISLLGALPCTTSQADTPCLDETCVASEAEAAARYVRDDDIDGFAIDLASAGRFAAARTALARLPAPKPGDTSFTAIRHNNARSALVLSEMAAATWDRPSEIASYEAVDTTATASGGTPNAWETASRYWLLAKKITERFEPSLIPPDLVRALSRRIVRHGRNATLDDLLHRRWPEAIEKLPEREQGFLWDDMAEIYTELGNTAAAEKMLDRAEQRGGYEVFPSITHSWLRLGNPDRALNAARQTNPKDSQTEMIIFVAEALLKSGNPDAAREVFREAAADFEHYQNKGGHLSALVGVAIGLSDLGDHEGAQLITERALQVARLPSLVPAFQLVLAAHAYNHIGDHEHAIALLNEAALRLPDPHTVMHFGTGGAVSGAGPVEETRTEIAKEFDRLGDRKTSDEYFALLSPYYQNTFQRWRIQQGLDVSHPERSPGLDMYLSLLPPHDRASAAWELAVSAIDDDETELARKLVRRALDDLAADHRPLAYTHVAKVAFAGGFSDLLSEALHKAADEALSVSEPGTRGKTLAAVAALQHELLTGADQ